MALIPWDPFKGIDRWFDELEPEGFFSSLPAIKTPKMDVYEDKGNVVVEAEIPGVKPEDIDVEITDNALKVEAESEEKKEKKEKGYYRKEISSGYYKRIIPLPVEVKGEKAKASYEDGVLKIVIPKKEEKPKEKKGLKIKVKKTK